MLSYSAPPTPAPVHVPRGPLSPSTTVSPLVTPNNTLGGRPGFHKRRPSQATLILSQIASRSPVQHSRTGQSTPKRQSREMSDYFDQKPQDGAHTPRAEELHCGEKPSRVVLQRTSTYVSFPDFEKMEHVRKACRQYEQRRLDVCQMRA